MATTNGIWTPDGSDEFDPPTDLQQMAASIDAQINQMTPSGGVIAFGGSVAPAGWLLCQGQAISRTTYARLYNAIGTHYGNGDGSATFNIPNARGRTIVGKALTWPEFITLGKMGGSRTHRLTVAEMPNHSHVQQVDSPGVGVRPMAKYTNSGVGVHLPKGVPIRGRSGPDEMRTKTRGSSQAHNNLQPYLVLNYIIKT